MRDISTSFKQVEGFPVNHWGGAVLYLAKLDSRDAESPEISRVCVFELIGWVDVPLCNLLSLCENSIYV